jgi:REP element-mobilizing transposase RayT
LRLHVPGALFHVTQRGNDRRAIFLDDQDRTQYLGILGRSLWDGRERLHAYCLLTNHVHLLLQSDDRPLSDLMQLLGSRYARRFNERWSHTGHLFQGRFHASLMDDDAHLLGVVRYVHLNPCRAGLVRDPADHRWSSHRAYLGEAAPQWLSTSLVRSALVAEGDTSGIAYAQLMNAASDDDALQGLAGRARSRNEEPKTYLGASLDLILEEVALHSGCSVQEICGPGRSHRASAARLAVALLARTLSRSRLSEVARVLGRDPATLSSGIARRMRRGSTDWLRLVEEVRHSLSSK